MKTILFTALLLVSGSVFAHSNGASAAGGLVGSSSGASSAVGVLISGNGSASDSVTNSTYGYAGVNTSTTRSGVSVSTSSGTGSSQKALGHQTGANTISGAAGQAGSTSGAIAGGGVLSIAAPRGW
jgi:hypothetical protein